MRTISPRHVQPLDLELDAVLKQVLGGADPRTLSPGDFGALRSALDRRGVLRHPGLVGALRARRIQPDAVLRGGTVRSMRWQPVARPPAWTLGRTTRST